ncbi:L,D-transpeptidase family protein [Mucilaginibacter sp. ZT4R22]|uniref:L,D-transpeptidase family protein n=1 Tax=Mucilaginibacter pankratovii TaxID=2772110 RepID=A0ABR7WJY4_9SPHI|nr:L,D-transpeptidase family protein [Mucilaginibacter pankratovii]MBD1362634.1 L,D-transpeptidase family protein [Mucilaginibacter pankratovii]
MMKNVLRNRYKLELLFVILLLINSGCKGQSKKSPTKVNLDTIVKGNFNPASGLAFDSVSIDSFLNARPFFRKFSSDLKQFYHIHLHKYAWFDAHGITESANNLINHIQTQEDDGVLKEYPYKTDFKRMADQLRISGSASPRVDYELMLTAEYFNYAKNVWGGAEVDKTKDIGWYLPRKKLEYLDLLQKQLNGSRDSVEQNAVIPQYLELRKALHRYRQIEQSGPDVILSYNAGFAGLKPGDTSSLIIPLTKRLHQLQYLQNLTPFNTYNPELLVAITLFKSTHGITPDSKINAKFIQQLSVPVHKRIEQIIVNLERLRWIPADDHGGEFILVNIPEFQLHYYNSNALTWSCKVVVGKAMTKTVIFSGHLQYIVFSPYWYIPPSIIQKEIKPGMARNSNYLAAHNMEWNGGNVRQKPGTKNSLGLVKFIFPNSNNIYLHDTPAKPLFAEDTRAFSHGCIRVGEPKELAIKILKQDASWSPERIDAAMHAGRENTVILKNKIPVYIGYFTAFVNSKGELNFREDIYKRDEQLLKLLMQTDL